MNSDARLILEDGTVFKGKGFGSNVEVIGEVVFNTSMTGYQEMLTDPSYAGQILIPTYPLIGNYGINKMDVESNKVQVSGFVVRNHCENPSHPLSEMTIDQYLFDNKIPGISGIDTRSLAKKIRSSGVMMGLITFEDDIDLSILKLKTSKKYEETDSVSNITTDGMYKWENDNFEKSKSFVDMYSRSKKTNSENKIPNILIVDFGIKYNIPRSIRARGCDVKIVPPFGSYSEILDLNPDGIILSPGPGDPKLLDKITREIRKIVGIVPIMGICLGHQIIARSMGARTFKLHYGHRGGNQPVKDLFSGNIYVTAQNHGYAVDKNHLPKDFEISHINLNDDTVEGLVNEKLNIMTIQYHSEASPGPHDSEYLFDRFLSMVTNEMGKKL
tara:strand:+ start:507 stop:1664 length:1158 start_codon:yes stop_codon:yes gene_type:complete